MANLPAASNQSSPELTRIQDRITDLLADGKSPGAIAKALAKGDEKQAKVWRRRIRQWSYSNEAFQTALAQKAQGEMRLAIPVAAQALSKRAARGRTDAIRTLFEATGFHNPRVQHEHSGDIQISLNIPRPLSAGADPGKEAESEPVDAEVVDE